MSKAERHGEELEEATIVGVERRYGRQLAGKSDDLERNI
jgi:hypothetical protein